MLHPSDGPLANQCAFEFGDRADRDLNATPAVVSRSIISNQSYHKPTISADTTNASFPLEVRSHSRIILLPYQR
jgi:hypothetical protein